MVKTGLDIISGKLPGKLAGKNIGVLCHASSITKDFVHIIDFFSDRKDCRLTTIFGPQHGIYGQTQDNMIEWEGGKHPIYGVPLFSLYGKHRKPAPFMLKDLDAFIIDLQDVGARLYTYVWTVKLCIEACSEASIPVWILDRPNPIGRIPCDGPVLKEDFFTFVGGASIPLCHRMTIGEMALWIKTKYYPSCDLNIVWMEGWIRDTLYHETGLPWVLPSPNMPTPQTAIVYPGTVLIEGLNLSEGRGTTIPFELFGAPFLNSDKLIRNLENRNVEGCRFRKHDFIPTFNKYRDLVCHGIQIHVTDPARYFPVAVAMEIFDAIIETSAPGSLKFKEPPYEYEEKLMPFDILSGDSGIRTVLINRDDIKTEKERWKCEIEEFRKEFQEFSAYS
ncbi:MAG: DUF1343 domain-containing protein [Bacteroidales bacterium]|jgi:uncharacterized protein YbbC (DUF1343 family)|nr:DUF1343 domain-containing protein [Bacteroidales bacterium]